MEKNAQEKQANGLLYFRKLKPKFAQLFKIEQLKSGCKTQNEFLYKMFEAYLREQRAINEAHIKAMEGAEC